jgi:hypothetical protein
VAGGLFILAVSSLLLERELRRGIWAAVVLLETYALRNNRGAGLTLNFRL